MLASGRVSHHRFERLNRNSRREALSAERRSAERRADAEMMRAKLPFPQRSQGRDVGRGEKRFNPIGSMYGIFTYIWLIFMVNVGKYTIHGSYGNCKKRTSHVFFGGRKAVIYCQSIFASLFFR